MSDLLVAVTIAAVVGCGLSAGALFAFSSFVMRALARLPAPQGIAAMNSINVVAVTPVFMTALFGTGLLCIALAVWAFAGLLEEVLDSAKLVRWDVAANEWLHAHATLTGLRIFHAITLVGSLFCTD